MTGEFWASGACHYVREHQTASPLENLQNAVKQVRALCYTIFPLSVKQLCCISTEGQPINIQSSKNLGIALVKAKRL
jgi:hypothetical protein